MLPNLLPVNQMQRKALIGKTVKLLVKESDKPLKYRIIGPCVISKCSRREMTVSATDERSGAFGPRVLTLATYMVKQITEVTDGP
jgi:hypothetical protein